MAAVDAFPNMIGGLDTPYTTAEAVTPSDSVELVNVSRALFIGTAGNVAVITLGGQTVTLKNLANGAVVRIRVKQVKATGTTATDIVALS